MAAIQLSGVGKQFQISRGRRVQALCSMDLCVAEGEFVSLLGPSGCGKSTILHLIAGLDEPSEGSVLVGGLPPHELQRRRELGIAFQEPALLPWRSVAANLELPFQIAGLTPDLSRIAGLIDLVGLKGFETARPSQLSGGMRQRGAGFGFFLGSYTGVLLSVSNQPIWSDTHLLGALFLASAASACAI